MLQMLTGPLLCLLLGPLVVSCTTSGPEAVALADADYGVPPPYAHGYWRDPSWDAPPVVVLRPPPQLPPPPAVAEAPPPAASERPAAPQAQAGPPLLVAPVRPHPAVPHTQPVFRAGPANGIVVVPRPDARRGEPPNRPVVSGSTPVPPSPHHPSPHHPPPAAAPRGTAQPERHK